MTDNSCQEGFLSFRGYKVWYRLLKPIDWNIEERGGEIQVPTLLLSGRYDEVTPACVETVHQGISGSDWVLFENSSHMPHLEETERFMEVVDEFLSRQEASPT